MSRTLSKNQFNQFVFQIANLKPGEFLHTEIIETKQLDHAVDVSSDMEIFGEFLIGGSEPIKDHDNKIIPNQIPYLYIKRLK